MTDLVLSEESKQYQNLARDFFQNEVASKSEKLDHEAKFPLELYKAAWELGLATAFIPENLGGLGLPLWDAVVMAEEAGAASGGVAAIFEGNALAVSPVLLHGTDQQKEEYISKLTSEPALASYCFSPQSDGSSHPIPAALVSRKGDAYELSGTGLAAINGEQAAWYLVLAQHDDNNDASVFVFPASLSGITRGTQWHKLGRRCADICLIDFNKVQLDKSHLLGKQGNGTELILESNCISATITSAHAAGLMQCALDNSVRYSKERQTFGKPISKHQSVAFMLADIARKTQCARLMTWKAAKLFDEGVHDYVQALCGKAYSIDAAMSCATDAVQIYGGYGYSKEYPVERLMRDAKMMQMMAGTSFELKCKIGELLLAQ